MSDPQIKYDIKADVSGDAEADKLATALRGVGDVLEGDLQTSAQEAAKALEALTAKQRAVEEFARLKAEARETATALDAATKAVDALGNELPKASANTRTLAEAEKAMAAELEKSQAELDNKKKALAQLREETASATKRTDEYKASEAGLKSEIAATSAEIKTRKTDLASISQGLTQAQAAEAALSKEYQRSTTELEKSRAELASKKQALAQLREETASATKRNEEYKAAEAGLKAEIAATSAEIKTRKADLAATTQGLAQAQAAEAALSKEYQRSTAELEKSRSELVSKKQALAQLREETASATRRTEEYKAAEAGLKAEIAATSAEIKNRKADLTSATQGLTQAQAAEAALTKEYKQATAEAAKASAELGGYNRKLDESRTALKAAGIDTGKLSQAKQNLSKAVSVAQADLKKLGETSVASGAAMQRSGKDAATGIEEISTQLQRVQNAYIALQGGGELGSMIKSALDTADAYNNLESRIKLAAGGGKDFAQTMQDVADISLRTHSSLETTGDLFAKLTMSGKSAGLSAKDAQAQALALTESINQAVQLSSASAQASDAAITQLVQGLNGGALRGDEFNSVMEQSPRLARAMADGLGVTTGELRKMAEAGALTAETVIRSLRSQSDTLKTEFQSLPPTVGRAIQDLGTAWMLYVGEADKGTGASVAAAQAIGLLSTNLKTVAGFLIDAGQAAAGLAALKLAQHFLGIGAAATASATAITATAAATTAAGAAAATTTVQMGRMATMLATLRAFTLIGIVTNFKDIGTWIGESIAKLQGYKDQTEELIKQEEVQRKALQEKKNQQLLANDAIKAAENAQMGLTKATAATVDKFEQLVKSGKSASEAIADIGKDFDLSKLPGIRDAGIVLNALVAKGKITATEFQQAWADALKGEDLAVFAAKAGAAFDSTGRDADVAAKITEQVLIAAVGRAGASYEALAGKVSKASASAINDTQAIINGLGQLEKMGIDTGAALQASIGNGINTANTQAALDAVKAQIEQVRRVLGEKVANDLLDQLSDKSKKLNKDLQETEQAFARLGIKSQSSLKDMADQAAKDFQRVRESGDTTAASLAEAWRNMAESAIAANGGLATETLKAQAAMYGLRVEVDAVGKATVTSMATGVESMQQYAQAVRQTSDAVELLNTKYQLASQYSQRQVELLHQEMDAREALMDLKQREIDLENRRRGVDREGFRLDRNGNREVQQLQTQRSVYDNAKGQGLSDAEALELARRFVSDYGELTGAASADSSRGESWGTELQKAIDAAVLANAAKAAQAATRQPAATPANQAQQAAGAAKTYNVTFGGRTVKTASDADAQALMQMLNDARLSA